MKRYTFNVDCCFNESLDESADGDVCKYEDVVKLEAELTAANARIAAHELTASDARIAAHVRIAELETERASLMKHHELFVAGIRENYTKRIDQYDQVVCDMAYRIDWSKDKELFDRISKLRFGHRPPQKNQTNDH